MYISRGPCLIGKIRLISKEKTREKDERKARAESVCVCLGVCLRMYQIDTKINKINDSKMKFSSAVSLHAHTHHIHILCSSPIHSFPLQDKHQPPAHIKVNHSNLKRRVYIGTHLHSHNNLGAKAMVISKH